MTAPLYSTDFPGLCLTREIDDMLLVFHRPSGATHFLDSPVPEMLGLLGEGPVGAEALGEALCERLGIPADAEAQAVIAARLEELVAVGLVQRG